MSKKKKETLYDKIRADVLDKVADKAADRLLDTILADEFGITGMPRKLIEDKLGQFFSPEDVNEIKKRFPVQNFRAIYSWLISADQGHVDEAVDYFKTELEAAAEEEEEEDE